MGSTSLPYLIGSGLVGLITATGTYLMARWRTSGRARRVEADTLWKAQEILRRDLMAEVKRRGQQVDRLSRENDELTRKLWEAQGKK